MCQGIQAEPVELKSFWNIYYIRVKNVNSFPVLFKHRIIDCYKQEWFATVNRSNILEDYI